MTTITINLDAEKLKNACDSLYNQLKPYFGVIYCSLLVSMCTVMFYCSCPPFRNRCDAMFNCVETVVSKGYVCMEKGVVALYRHTKNKALLLHPPKHEAMREYTVDMPMSYVYELDQYCRGKNLHVEVHEENTPRYQYDGECICFWNDRKVVVYRGAEREKLIFEGKSMKVVSTEN